MRLIFWIFLALWVSGIVLHFASVYHWFSNDTEPMAKVVLLLIGAPWNIFIQRYWVDNMTVLIAAPAINFTIMSIVAASTDPRRTKH